MTPQSTQAERPLCTQLREQTLALRWAIERSLGLPGSIHTRDDYVIWLGGFLGLHGLLERLCSTFPGWGALDVTVQPRGRTDCVIADPASPGTNSADVNRATPLQLPEAPTFAHTFGASYAVEGATLGGRVILRDLGPLLGATIAGVARFFGGRGNATEPVWQIFRLILDSCGPHRPQNHTDVGYRTERTFRAMPTRLGPLRGAVDAPP